MSLEGGIRRAAQRRATAARWDRKPSCISGNMLLEYVFREFRVFEQSIEWVVVNQSNFIEYRRDEDTVALYMACGKRHEITSRGSARDSYLFQLLKVTIPKDAFPLLGDTLP